uniref:Uncharacterized protein n=1 Tax=Mucochytrium quahogii TaxID=96639 RepID=A0A7S2SIK2_9STRA|mmetsp:Transcript_6507/g.14366  ORF Transcript_6507/g.14366 Transcript_6507/m.14366 type:complete len:1323 (+) Transcript_6507:105-4073(+)
MVQKKSSEDSGPEGVAVVPIVQDDEEENAPAVSVFSLFKFSTGLDYALILIGTVGAIINGATMPVYSIVLGNMYTAFQAPDADILAVGSQYAVYLLYIAIGAFIGASLQMGCFTLSSERQVIQIRKEYLDAVLKQDITWFDKRKNGELSAKIAENTVLIRDGIGSKFGNLIQNVSQFFTGFVIGYIYNWKLALVMTATSPTMVLGGYFMSKTMISAGAAALKAYSTAGGIAEESFGMIRTVSSLGLESRLTNYYRQLLVPAEKAGMKKSMAQGIGMAFTLFVYFLTYAVSFWYGSVLVKNSREDAAAAFPNLDRNKLCNPQVLVTPAIAQTLGCNNPGFSGNYTFHDAADYCACSACACGCSIATNCVQGGDIVLVFFAVLVGSFALGQATPGIAALINAKVAAAQIFQVIERVPEINETGDTPAAIEGKIELRNVEFSYPSRPDAPIFTDLNLTINPGETVALVGGSGSGKSTVTQLVQRFYNPSSGNIFIDGRDISELNVAWLRDQIALVGQEPVLFATSIEENIKYGARKNQNLNREDVEHAVRSANAHDFIATFPEGLDTRVGTQGGLSGGQKQRIAIARAIIRDPSILILDEATSALDNTSEKIVQQALDQLMMQKKRTTIVIAHRLSTVRNADKIVVMGDGGVLEQGSHDALMAIRNGHYSALVQAAERSQSEEHNQSGDGQSIQLEASFDIQKQQNAEHCEEDEAIIDVDGEKLSRRCCGLLKAKEKKKSVSLTRLLAYCTHEKWYLIPALIASIVAGAFPPVLGILLGGISNVYYLPTIHMMTDKADSYALDFVYCSVVVGAGFFFQIYCFGYVGEKMTSRIRADLFQTILRQDVSFFDKTSVGALSAQLSTDAALVKATLGDRFGLIVQNGATVLIGLGLALSFGWKLTLVLMVLLPIIAFAGMFEMFAIKGFAKQDEESMAEASSILTESVNGIRTVSAFALRGRIVSLYDGFLAGPTQLAVKRGLVGGICYGISQGILYVIFAVAFYYGSRLMVFDDYTFQDLTNVFFAVFLMGLGMGQAAAMASDVAKGSSAVDSVFTILDRKSAIDPFDESGLRSEDQTSTDIVFTDVDFAYPARPEAKVLDKFSLAIHEGSTVALVGQSGSGKSTMVNFLERFYDPQGGSVHYNGINVKEANTKWLRGEIGFVQQEPKLFDTTIFENIAFGVPENGVPVTQEQVEQAAKAANAHDFIMSFPDGYQTTCGRAGKKLSGGQKQRICLARCIIRDPKVLLLDEATSALDNESERIVQDALDKLMEDNTRTTIVIAHRLSTIQNADLICVVSHGTIIETGTHAQLMANPNGVYYKMYTATCK